jgi:hypothetical protein
VSVASAGVKTEGVIALPTLEADPAIASRTACTASAITDRSSLMSVGRNPVVPKRRCARPMARIASTVGDSLKSTPPPPFTCASMKPGSSIAPSRSWRRAPLIRGSASEVSAAMRPPSMRTARPSTKPSSARIGPLTMASMLSGCA